MPPGLLEIQMNFKELYSILGRSKGRVNNFNVPVTVNGEKDFEVKITPQEIKIITTDNAKVNDAPKTNLEAALAKAKAKTSESNDYKLPGLTAKDINDVVDD